MLKFLEWLKCGSRQTLCLLLIVCMSGASQCSAANVSTTTITETANQKPRHLIICVDGVGIKLIERMQTEGRFKNFKKASRLLAPFPTLTNIAMSEALRPAGAPAALGYEDSFYDSSQGRIRGTLFDRFSNNRFIKSSFRELFDYHPSAIKSGLGYLLPPVSTYLEALTDLVRLRQKFLSSNTDTFFAYTGASDSLAHLGGESFVRRFLARLDDTMTRIKRESPRPVEVTIFSDHGNHFTKYRRVNLKTPLRRAGFRFTDRVQDEHSVVFPQFGLIGCAVLFATENTKPRLAHVAAEVRGVDFAAYEENETVYVVNRTGRALIERRETRFRYRVEQGDPLGLIAVARQLAFAGKADTDGFIEAREWFTATLDDKRPDAVRRIYEGVTKAVRHRASVIINFEDGYYSGSYSLDLLSILKATHGNLGQQQSYGFVMSTAHVLPTHLPADHVWQAIGSPALHKAMDESESSVRHDSLVDSFNLNTRK